MKNSSGIKPTHYNVLVAPKRLEEKTTGGVFLPSTTKEKLDHAQKEGVLLAMSPFAFSYSGEWPDGAKPEVGQRVLFSRYAADEVTGIDGEKYWLMKDVSITAVMDYE